MNASAAELLGMLTVCGGAAAGLVLSDRRARLAAMGVALAVAPVLVLGSVWSEPRVVDFRTSPAQIAAAIVVGSAALAALVWAFRRWPEAFAIAAFAVLPLRVPIEIGGETANLLVPLYLVIVAGVIVRALASDEPRAAADRSDPWPARLRWVLAATLVLYAVQASYSVDVSNAIENIGFFLAPFAVLFALLLEVEWSRRLLRHVLVAVVAVACACALVGIYQYFARDLFLNPELFDANELHVYFRVNSLFFDPNVFGRYLALALTALGACVAWGGNRRDLAVAAAAFALGLVGLAFSYSLTSMASLLAGLGTVALLRWSWRGGAAFAALGSIAIVVLLIAGGTPTSDVQDVRSIDSGHADLIKGGLVLAGLRSPDNGAEDVGTPDRRLRVGVVRAGLLRPHRAGADHGLALGADHRRRRAGGDRPGRLRAVAGLLACRRPRPARRRLARAHGGRRLLRGDPDRQLRLHGVHDRPRDVGAARARARPAAESARARRHDLVPT